MAAQGWIIVTGGNTGIGFETCIRLAAQNVNLILCSRDRSKGEEAVSKIKTLMPAASIELMILDLADLESIRKFVDDFSATGKELAVLINNAGMAPQFNSSARQGVGPHNWEVTMATNHLGTFLLTNLLIPKLKERASAGGEARIVVVASSITENENWKPFDVDDILYEKPGSYTSGKVAYKNSKAANIMFTYELARRLEKTGVTVNCVCPGFIPATGLARNNSAILQWIMTNVIGGFIGTRLLRIPARTVDVGAERLIDLAVCDVGKGVSGLYFKDGKPRQSSAETRVVSSQLTLWETSAKLVAL